MTEELKPEICECGYELDSFACRIRHQHLDLSWTKTIH